MDKHCYYIVVIYRRVHNAFIAIIFDEEFRDILVYTNKWEFQYRIIVF